MERIELCNNKCREWNYTKINAESGTMELQIRDWNYGTIDAENGIMEQQMQCVELTPPPLHPSRFVCVVVTLNLLVHEIRRYNKTYIATYKKSNKAPRTNSEDIHQD